MTTQGYTHPEFLVDAAWVDGHKGDANVVIVDCDVEAGYNRGHIPSAVMVPDNFEKNPDSGRVHIMNPDQFAAMCQGLGIGDDSLVVTYDNAQGLTAARLWWALNYYGHTNVKVLNGGWRRWVSEGLKVDFARPSANTGVKFTPTANEAIMCRLDELKDGYNKPDVVVWDVRSDGEWDGSASRGNKRVGHVPGAVHLEWFNMIDRDTHQFKAADEIRRILTEHGITPDKTVYSY
ncbi:MAG: sulfurtransferase [Chloroflexi bacterium]|nr:sulfurtransferase [Chloroflexota bacterium]